MRKNLLVSSNLACAPALMPQETSAGPASHCTARTETLGSRRRPSTSKWKIGGGESFSANSQAQADWLERWRFVAACH